jgi:hypothetical protein
MTKREVSKLRLVKKNGIRSTGTPIAARWLDSLAPVLANKVDDAPRPSRIWMCFLSGLDGIYCNSKDGGQLRRGAGSAARVESSRAMRVPAEAAPASSRLSGCLQGAGGLFPAPRNAKPD